MSIVDLGPAAQRLADLVTRVGDDELGLPTPCPAYTLGDLIDHVGGLALAFTASARATGLMGRRQAATRDTRTDSRPGIRHDSSGTRVCAAVNHGGNRQHKIVERRQRQQDESSSEKG